jgi:hypothetical protein
MLLLLLLLVMMMMSHCLSRCWPFQHLAVVI